MTVAAAIPVGMLAQRADEARGVVGGEVDAIHRSGRTAQAVQSVRRSELQRHVRLAAHPQERGIVIGGDIQAVALPRGLALLQGHGGNRSVGKEGKVKGSTRGRHERVVAPDDKLVARPTARCLLTYCAPQVGR